MAIAESLRGNARQRGKNPGMYSMEIVKSGSKSRGGNGVHADADLHDELPRYTEAEWAALSDDKKIEIYEQLVAAGLYQKVGENEYLPTVKVQAPPPPLNGRKRENGNNGAKEHIQVEPESASLPEHQPDAPSPNGQRNPKIRDLYGPLDKFIRETQAQGYTVTVERLDAPCEPCSLEDIKNTVKAFRDQYAGDVNEITIEYLSDADTSEITIVARHLKDTNIPDQLVARYRVVTRPLDTQQSDSNPQEPTELAPAEEIMAQEHEIDVPEGEPFTMERLRVLPYSGLVEVRYAMTQKKGKPQTIVSMLQGRANAEQYLTWLIGAYGADITQSQPPFVWRVVDRAHREYELLIPATNNSETTYVTVALKANVNTLAGLKYSSDIALDPDKLAVSGYVDAALTTTTLPTLEGFARTAPVESAQFAHDAMDFYAKEVASYRAYLNGSPFDVTKAVDCLSKDFMIPACLLQAASDGDIRVYAQAVCEYTITRLHAVVLQFIEVELNKRRETLVMNSNKAVIEALDAHLSQTFLGWENYIHSLWKGVIRRRIVPEKKQQLLLAVESAYVPFVPELPSNPSGQMLALRTALDTFHASMNTLERQGQQRELTQQCQKVENDLAALVKLVIDPKNGVRKTLRDQFYEQWTGDKTGDVRIDITKLAKDQTLRLLFMRGLSEVLQSPTGHAALNGAVAQKRNRFGSNGKHPVIGEPTLVERIHEYLDPTSEMSLDAIGVRIEAEREKDVLPLPDDLRYAIMAANKENSGSKRLQNLSSFSELIDQCITIQRAVRPKEGQIQQITSLFKHPMFARARALAVARDQQKNAGKLYGKEMIAALEKNLVETLGEHTYRQFISEDPTLLTGVYTSLIEAQMHNLELAIALQEEVEMSVESLTKTGGKKRQRQPMPVVIAVPQEDEYLKELVARFAQLDLVRLGEFLKSDKRDQGKGKSKNGKQNNLYFGDGFTDGQDEDRREVTLSDADMQVVQEFAIHNRNPVFMMIASALLAVGGRVDQLDKNYQKIIDGILDKHEQEKKQGKKEWNRNRS